LHDAGKVARSSLGELENVTIENAESHGEVVYSKYHLQGVRLEAAQGFPAVLHVGLPTLRAYLAKGFSQNDAGVATLLSLIPAVSDTNIVSRTSAAKLIEVQKAARAIMDAELTAEELIQKAVEMDKWLIQEHISPGGSADLLAVTWFIENMVRL
jgi:holo-ACP synthase/triphosphoribosyl-dephospho-CoA synthase